MQNEIIFDAPHPNKEITVGQFYQRKGGLYDGEVFLVTTITIMSGQKLYGLHALNDGEPWITLCYNIDDIFGKEKQNFVKVDAPFTVIPKI